MRTKPFTAVALLLMASSAGSQVLPFDPATFWPSGCVNGNVFRIPAFLDVSYTEIYDPGFDHHNPPAETSPAARFVDDDAVGAPNRDGTAQRPWATLDEAFKALVPGQTWQALYVAPGTYRGPIETPIPGSAGAPMWLLARKQSPTDRVAIESTPAQAQTLLRISQPYWVVRGVEFDGKGQQAQLIHVSSTDHVVLDGIDAHASAAGTAVAIENSQDVVVRSSRIHENVRPGDDGHGIAVMSGSRNVLIQGNEAWGNSGDSVQCQSATDVPGGTRNPPAPENP